MRNRTKTSSAALWVAIALVLGMLMGALLSPGSSPHQAPAQKRNQFKISNVLQLIEDEYVDQVDCDSLVEQLLNVTLQSLDPHSRYLSQKELSKEDEYLQGHFEGIGVVLYYLQDTACVEQVFANGPSFGKLQTGDRIISVNGEDVAGVGLSNTQIVERIRGPRRSKVDIAIRRYGEKGLRHVSVQRDVIATPSVSYSGMLDNHTGYIRLTRFVESSYDEFFQAASKLKKQGMTDLIFDLRDNGGGLLDQAIMICDELLPKGNLIVYTEGAHEARKDVRSTHNGIFSSGHLSVLINENSASASEIVSGAIQDNDRGIIIGRRSFGKGLVQRQFMLPDRSAIFLTVSRYYTPSGRCIQRPYDKGTDEYYNDYLRQVMYDFSADSSLTRITDSTPYHTLKGRIVYGGGGIYPDFTLPYRTDPDVVYYNHLLEKSLPTRFAFDFVTREWNNLNRNYPDAKRFIDQFNVSDALWQQFLSFADKNDVSRDPKSLAKYGSQIRLRLKGDIANCLFGNEAFYQIMLSQDEDLERARSITKNHFKQ